MAKKGLRFCKKVKKETKPENFKIFNYEISSIKKIPRKIHNKVLVTVNYTIGLNEENIQTTNSNQSNS